MTPVEIVEEVGAHLKAGPTGLLTHASYEPRSTSVTALSWAGVDLQKCVVLGTTESLEKLEKYRDSANTLLSYFEGVVGQTPVLLSRHRADRIGWLQGLEQTLRVDGWSRLTNIVVDISVFPRDRLWFLIDLLQRVLPRQNHFALYSEPAHYGSAGESGWLTRGVRSISDLPGFNGVQHTQKKTLLIIVVGHEHERPSITIRDLEPAKVVLLCQGGEQYAAETDSLTKSVEYKIQDDALADVLVWKSRIGSRDVDGTRAAIGDIYAEYEQTHNIAITCFGTKLQTLGALVACQELRPIRGVYAEPQTYNTDSYSEGLGRRWLIALPSGGE